MASQRQAIHMKMEEIRQQRAEEKALKKVQEAEYAIQESGQGSDAQEGREVEQEAKGQISEKSEVSNETPASS